MLKALLYQNNNLVPGTHAVKVSNSPYAFTGQTLSIDFAITYGPSSTKWVFACDPRPYRKLISIIIAVSVLGLAAGLRPRKGTASIFHGIYN